MKRLSTFVLASLVAVSVSVSRPAQAVALGGPLSFPVGFVGFMGPSIVGLTVNGFFPKSKASRWLGKHAMSITIANVAVALGMILLSDEKGQTVSFKEISSADAQSKGLTKVEAESFNSEVDQLNIMAAHVDAELSKLEKPTIEASVALWSDLKSNLSTETISAVNKLVTK